MKKTFIVIATVIAVSLFGFLFYQLNADGVEPTLSAEEIKLMVTSQYPGEITKLELEKDRNQAVYEIEIVDEEREYELRLDGNSGEVLKLKERENLTSLDQNDEKVQHDNKRRPEKQPKKAKFEQSNDLIGICKAVEIAQQQQIGMLEEIELEIEKDTYYYEAKIRNNDQKSKLKIDAKTGEIIKTKAKSKNHPSKTMEQVRNEENALINFCQAVDIAVQEHPGNVVEIELENDDGKLIYEITIYDDLTKISIDIDALTGDILVIEIGD